MDSNYHVITSQQVNTNLYVTVGFFVMILTLLFTDSISRFVFIVAVFQFFFN